MINFTLDNLPIYISGILTKQLGYSEADISDLQITEITEQTYVNYIFKIEFSTNGKKTTYYLRQTRDHVRTRPDIKLDPARIEFEVKILRLLNSIQPGVVPEVIYFDETNNSVILTDIRNNNPLLVDELLNGNPHPETADYFGKVIATYHTKTINIDHSQVHGSEVTNDAAVKFHLGMRLEPALKEFPELTDKLITISNQSIKCLVLGDLASKNIVVDSSKIRFMDLERAFVGDPAFDLAFLFCHYLIEIKPDAVDQSLLFIPQFMESYLSVIKKFLPEQELALLQNRILRFLGVTILYRFFGLYLVVNVERDTNKWHEVAHQLLQDTTSCNVSKKLNPLINHS